MTPDDFSSSNTERPALVIVIQSRMTLLIGLVMLLAGGVIGYLSRPSLAQWLAPEPTRRAEVVITVVASTAALPEAQATLASVAPTATPNVVAVTPPPTPDTSAQAAQLMSSLIAQTRHFKGDPAALVTLIEFGDFQ